MLEFLGAVLGTIFIVVFLIPYLFIAFTFMWEVLIYPFWKEVFDKIRGSLGSVKK